MRPMLPPAVQVTRMYQLAHQSHLNRTPGSVPVVVVHYTDHSVALNDRQGQGVYTALSLGGVYLTDARKILEVD